MGLNLPLKLTVTLWAGGAYGTSQLLVQAGLGPACPLAPAVHNAIVGLLGPCAPVHWAILAGRNQAAVTSAALRLGRLGSSGSARRPSQPADLLPGDVGQFFGQVSRLAMSTSRIAARRCGRPTCRKEELRPKDPFLKMICIQLLPVCSLLFDFLMFLTFTDFNVAFMLVMATFAAITAHDGQAEVVLVLHLLTIFGLLLPLEL